MQVRVAARIVCCAALLLCLRAGHLNVGHVHQQGVFSPAELSTLRLQLRRDLLGVDVDR